MHGTPSAGRERQTSKQGLSKVLSKPVVRRRTRANGGSVSRKSKGKAGAMSKERTTRRDESLVPY